MKLNALFTIITILTLANTDSGILKLFCWFGLVLEFIIFTMIFERDLQ